MADERLVSSLPSRFAVIDPNQLGRMAVLQDLDFEAIRSDRLVMFKQKWLEHDPPAGAQYDADAAGMEFDPIVIVEETDSYFEMLVRDRVNQAARSVTLAYAVGSDLDAIASRYPGGVPRMPLVDNPRGTALEFPEDYEDDERYRRRIWLSPDILSPFGSAESYIFWGLTSNVFYRDARALTKRDRNNNPTGVVYIPVLLNVRDASAWVKDLGVGKDAWTRVLNYDPLPTQAQRLASLKFISEKQAGRKALTDVVHVTMPKVVHVSYDIDVWTYPNVDPMTVMSDVRDALDKLVENKRWLGHDHTLITDIGNALSQGGVYRTVINSPLDDVIVGQDGFVMVDQMRVTYKGTGE